MAKIGRLIQSVPSPQSFSGKLLRIPLHLVPNNVIVPVLTGINRGMRWITGAGLTNGAWIGNYEADHTVALLKSVRPGMVAYDVGANAGFYTLAFSKLVGETGHVFAFEPQLEAAGFLRRHVEINRLRNVTIIQSAIADQKGLIGFSDIRRDDKSTLLVPTMSLDEFIAAGHPLPSFIKMDIEGAEGAALKGATAILEDAKAVWMFAAHSKELYDSCRATLAARGYRFAAFDCEQSPGDRWDFMALPGEWVASAN